MHSVLLKDFKPYVTHVSDTICNEVKAEAKRTGVAIEYVNDSSLSKEELAAELGERAGRTTGLRAILSAVEPCRTFFVRENSATGLLELQNRPGKCLHYYHYWRDEKLGPCHVRMQTWFPFNTFVCVNGREMLAGELTREGIEFRQRDNGFTWVKDVGRAQQLSKAQVEMDWSAELTRLLTASHSGWSKWPGMDRAPYWSAEQTEWATDVMFQSGAELSRLMPSGIPHAMVGMGTGDAMRFLGRSVRAERGEVLRRAGFGVPGGDDDYQRAGHEEFPGEGERAGRQEGMASDEERRERSAATDAGESEVERTLPGGVGGGGNGANGGRVDGEGVRADEVEGSSGTRVEPVGGGRSEVVAGGGSGRVRVERVPQPRRAVGPVRRGK